MACFSGGDGDTQAAVMAGGVSPTADLEGGDPEAAVAQPGCATACGPVQDEHEEPAEEERAELISWPVVQPELPRRPRFLYFGRKCGCCPAYVLFTPFLAVISFALGSIGCALALALVFAVYALCGCPLWFCYCVAHFWRFPPLRWVSDLYTKALFLSYQNLFFTRTPPDTSSRWMSPDRLQQRRWLEKYQVDYALHIEVPKATEEEFNVDPVAPNAITLFYEEVLSKMPHWDHFETFAEGEDPVTYVMNQLGHIYPAIYQEWTDKRSDVALVRFCQYGLGAHRVETTEEHGTRYYVVRTNALSPFPVRKGFARYGGDAYFDMNWRPVKIVDRGLRELRLDGGDDTVTTRLGDATWEEAKFRFRSSLSVLVTLVDHLYGIHLQTANLMVTAVREQLSPDHPVRRFMVPFTFQTIAINNHARNNLTQPRSMGPRCFAFTDLGLRLAFAAAPNLLVDGFEVPPEEGGPILNRSAYTDYLKQEKGVDTEYHRQAKKLWQICRKFVEDYFAYYYADPSEIAGDTELNSMFLQYFYQLEFITPARMRKCKPQAASHETLLDLLANYIFLVSAGHEQVGAVEVYVQDVSFCAFKWVPGALVGTKQTATAQALLMSFTSTEMPKLLGSDWTHLFLHRERPAQRSAKHPKEAFKDFQDALGTLSAECDAYNEASESRPFPECFPLYVMNPKLLETSISV